MDGFNIKDLDASTIQKQLETELEDAFKNPQDFNLLIDNLIQYDKKTNIFQKYSFKNALLLQRQRKNLTELRTFKSWSSDGVNILKGEKALYVLKPIPKCRTCKNLNECNFECKDRYVKYGKLALFDATQTDLKQEKINEIVEKNFSNKLLNPEFNELIEYLQSVKSFELEYNQTTDGEAGWTDGKKISITIDSNPELKNNILLHEFGHLYLDHATDNLGYSGHIRGVKEVQAEMFAWISEKILNIQTPASEIMAKNYINGWSTANGEKVDSIKEFSKVFNAVAATFSKPNLEQSLLTILENEEVKTLELEKNKENEYER